MNARLIKWPILFRVEVKYVAFLAKYYTLEEHPRFVIYPR